MWSFASKAIAGSIGFKKYFPKPNLDGSECSDDDVSSQSNREEGLECPICWESFNIVENVPYVLWCGHTLCKNCVLGLQRAVMKLHTATIQLPFFITCPWCHLFSVRLVYKGNLMFPRKNYFLLWMVENMNSQMVKSDSSFYDDQQQVWFSGNNLPLGSEANHRIPRRVAGNTNYFNGERLHSSIRKSLAFFMNLTAKFPLLVAFLLIVLYAIPASAAILVLYILITVLFALPSLLILYFAYPTLDWLVQEIIA